MSNPSKFIQIAVEAVETDGCYLFALDDNGDVWFRNIEGGSNFGLRKWFKMSDERAADDEDEVDEDANSDKKV